MFQQFRFRFAVVDFSDFIVQLKFRQHFIVKHEMDFDQIRWKTGIRFIGALRIAIAGLCALQIYPGLM